MWRLAVAVSALALAASGPARAQSLPGLFMGKTIVGENHWPDGRVYPTRIYVSRDGRVYDFAGTAPRGHDSRLGQWSTWSPIGGDAKGRHSRAIWTVQGNALTMQSQWSDGSGSRRSWIVSGSGCSVVGPGPGSWCRLVQGPPQ